MADLLFFTDRYPFNNSEAFIENEINIMASRFDNVYCLPCGLMVDTTTIRSVPSNVHVFNPPCKGNIYQGKPTMMKKVMWAFGNLFPWFILCLFNKIFYKELYYLFVYEGPTLAKLIRVFRTLAPSIRNMYYYRSQFKNIQLNDVYCYSYWLEPTIMFSPKIVLNRQIKKNISRTHRWDLYTEESPIKYLAFQRQIIEYIDNLYVISSDGFNYLSRKYPMFASKMSISRLGTTDNGLNIKSDGSVFRIVSCSNMIPVKRVNLIIEALSILSGNNTNVEWVHFGSGQYFQQIKSLSNEKLTRIKYSLKGIVPNKDILEYYKSNHVDLFINVSSSEGIPVSIMEATSFGIPIIATNVGGTSEVVINEKNGFLLDRDFDINELVADIIKIKSSPELQERMSKASRDVWKQYYSCVDNYAKFYDQLIFRI